MSERKSAPEAKRARRRRDLARMKTRARWVAHAIWGYADHQDQQRHERLANHLKACSCWMCGNQRKIWGPNWQEYKAARRADQQIAEIIIGS